MKKIMLSTVISATLAFGGGGTAPVVENVAEAPVAMEESSPWKHSLSVYGWLPSFDGTMRYTIPGDPADPGDPAKEGESSIIDNLDMIFMGSYEIRKDEWSFLLDVIYLKMSDAQEISVDIPRTNRTITIGSEQEFTAWVAGAYAGYNIVDTGSVSIDIIGGARYFSLALDVSAYINNRSINVSPSVEFYDGVVGSRGHFNLSKNWYMPYMVDIGAGDSELTYQGQASLGYRFSWGDVLATYRYIHYQQDDLRLLDDFTMHGPKIGMIFHF